MRNVQHHNVEKFMKRSLYFLGLNIFSETAKTKIYIICRKQVKQKPQSSVTDPCWYIFAPVQRLFQMINNQMILCRVSPDSHIQTYGSRPSISHTIALWLTFPAELILVISPIKTPLISFYLTEVFLTNARTALNLFSSSPSSINSRSLRFHHWSPLPSSS